MSDRWIVRVWGSRGSVPVSGPRHVRHGGQTTCVEIDLGHARILIDAGSGAAEFGRHAVNDLKPTLLLMTHLHWDHVLGFPHCPPIYMPGWSLDVRGVPREGQAVIDTLFAMNRPPLFPVDLRVGARVELSHTPLLESGEDEFAGVRYSWQPVAHPGGCTAFRFELGDRRFVFTGDLELARTDAEAVGRLVADADLLLIDAQYTPEEYPHHVGWGHSTNVDAARLAHSAGVGRLLLTHHDPRHNDDQLDAMAAVARTIHADTVSVHDGLTIRSSDLGR